MKSLLAAAVVVTMAITDAVAQSESPELGQAPVSTPEQVQAQPVVAGSVPDSAPASAPAPVERSIGEYLDEALTKIRVAESRGPDYRQAFQRARQIVDSVLARDALNERASYYRARLLILADRSREALSALERWIATDTGKSDWEAHLILGQLYARGGFHKLAKPSFMRALTLNPVEPSVLIELAKCEMNLLNYSAAADRMREALRILGPRATSAEQALLARVLARDGRLDEAYGQAWAAVETAQALAVEQPGDREAFRLMGDALTTALEIKQAQVERSPNDPGSCLEASHLIQRRAVVANQLNLLDALAWSLRGLEVGGPSAPPELYLDTAQLLWSVDRRGEARAMVEELLSLYPDHAAGQQMLRDMGPPPDGAPTPGDRSQPMDQHSTEQPSPMP